MVGLGGLRFCGGHQIQVARKFYEVVLRSEKIGKVVDTDRLVHRDFVQGGVEKVLKAACPCFK